MRLLDRLDRKLGKFAVHNLTIYLIAGQTLFYVLYMTGKLPRGTTVLVGGMLLQGEWWRAATFIFDPPASGPLFAFFAWYIFYFMGSALEEHWGAFRYNVFLLTGVVITILASLVVPYHPVSNTFLGGSVFLAFATLYPDFVLNLFMILPVKVKWLAAITWLGYAWQLLVGGWGTRIVVLASLCNFFLFFGHEFIQTLKSASRRRAYQARVPSRRADEAFHRCTVCGITDKTHPRMDFRYCPQCEGQFGYCSDHIFSHEHVRKG